MTTKTERERQVRQAESLLRSPIRTVGELITKLQRYNPTLPVLRETEEFGASGIEDCYLIENPGDKELPAFVFIGPSADLEVEEVE